jgi:hypothetical protein
MANDRKHYTSDYESEGRRIEACRARSSFPCKRKIFALVV